MSEELSKFVPLLSDNSKKKQKNNKDHKKKIGIRSLFKLKNMLIEKY